MYLYQEIYLGFLSATMIKFSFKNINWMRFRYLFFGFSLLLVIISLIGLLAFGIPLGVDFKGGALLEYGFLKDVSTEEIVNLLDSHGIEVTSVQKTGEGTYIFRISDFDEEQKTEFDETLKQFDEGAIERRYERVGPSIGAELINKTLYAILVSASIILLWIAYQFKNIRFGAAAILAMVHDSFLLVGLYSLMGNWTLAQIDFLFVTALLTTLSFSVHDTIVIFDRIREIKRKHGGGIEEVSNRAISETMRRSINNSLTIIFMLLFLVIFGGGSIRWFAVALLIGTILGTYSSPFVAVPILVEISRIKIKKKG